LTIEEYAVRLPKVELHLHLEGSVQPATMVELAGRNGVALPEFEQVSDLYRYDNLLDFLKIYNVVCSTMRTAEDFRHVTFEALQSSAAGGARRVEFFFSPHAHLEYGVGYGEMLDGIIRGMRDAEVAFGVTSGLIPAHSRVLGPEGGGRFLEMVLGDRRPEVIGMGLDYDELPNNPALFHGLYDAARAAGLHVTAHAGEVGPAEFVREAIDVLKVERVDHGYHIVDDPALVAECRERGTYFTCCPSTTLTTTIWRDLADPGHAIRRMIDAGLKVTLNTDDPPMFGTNLGREVVVCATEMKLTAEQLGECALNSVRASWMDEGTKQRWVAEWTEEIAGLKAQLRA
jgi:adenosine deaminase